MGKRFVCSIFIIIILILSCTGSDMKNLGRYIPEEINGWRKSGEDRLYDGETIFDYIDGAGEVYLMFSFRKMFVRYFEKSGQPNVFVELSDMGMPGDAFGLFLNNSEGEIVALGEGLEGMLEIRSEYRGGVFTFWKNRYLVSIVPEDETEETKQIISTMAREIESRIEEDDGQPEILDYLPVTNVVKNRIRYFHKHTTLNYHYYVSEENILELNENTDAVLAQYHDGSYLFYARYPDNESAISAYQSFTGSYIPEGKDTGYAELENGTWVGAEQEGRYVVVVFDAPDKVSVSNLLERCSFGEK